MKRGGGQISAHSDDVRRELFGLYAYRRGHATIEVSANEPADNSARQLGLVQRLVGTLPPQHMAALDRIFWRGEAMSVAADAFKVSCEHMQRVVASGVEILRHEIRKAAPEMMEA